MSEAPPLAPATALAPAGTGRAPLHHWEDFPVGQVRDFGGMPVSREAVIAFAQQFDPQPFHVDDEAARVSLFGGLCASGWHTCAMAMRMMCDGYLLDSASLGSPGIDNLRWLKPVFPGDTLSVRMEVLDARPMASKPHVGLLRSRWEVRNQHGQPVMTMEGWGMFRRRHVAEPAAAPPA
jgi:acyl dehydratase